ncbi:MAG: ATPase [Acidobacteria bacterium]|nr:MAG: ATPase [Acidobacteriota bacterium]
MRTPAGASAPSLLRRLAARATLTPVRVVALSFAAAIAVGTAALLTPAARRPDATASVVDALFTATSAMCLTGLVVVDTPTHWSGFGQGVILALIQAGGFGIMTMASLVGLLLANRIGLKARLNTAAEARASGLGDVRSVVVGVVRMSVLIEAVTAVAVILGGIGFPVLFEVTRHLRGRSTRWSLHTRLTVTVTAVLLVVGPALVLILEWTRTLQHYHFGQKLLVATFQGVMPRTAGFNSVDYAQVDDATLLVTDVLMFIGGGSGGTAGGIKVTTFVLLLFVIAAEARGERSVTVFDRRIDTRVQRQALSVALIGVGLVAVPTIVLLAGTGFDLDVLLFEVTSAFATVGLSTGITAQLPAWGQLVLVLLMYLGRIGSITLVSALAARERGRRYELPTERPFIG